MHIDAMLKRAHTFRIQLACLGEASRFGLVRLLQARSRFVTELAGEMGLSQSCTTRHLQALKRCGLVCAERRGKRVMYRLCSEDARAASLLGWALGDRSSSHPGSPAPNRTASPRSNGESARAPRRLARRDQKPADEPLGTPAAADPPDASERGVPDEVGVGAGLPAGHENTGEPPPVARPRRSGDLEDYLL